MIPKILCSKIIEHCILFRISRQLKYYRKSNRTLLHWATIFFLSKMVWWIFKKMFLRFLRAHITLHAFPRFLRVLFCNFFCVKYILLNIGPAVCDMPPFRRVMSVCQSGIPSVHQSVSRGGSLLIQAAQFPHIGSLYFYRYIFCLTFKKSG